MFFLLSLSISFVSGVEDSETEVCYYITSINDFPPPIRMEYHLNIPAIALVEVKVSPQAGEALLNSSRYVYEFENGNLVGVLGNFGTHGQFSPEYPSGISILKTVGYCLT